MWELQYDVPIINNSNYHTPYYKDPQFFRGFQIFCGSQSATLLFTSPLVTPILEYWRQPNYW